MTEGEGNIGHNSGGDPTGQLRSIVERAVRPKRKRRPDDQQVALAKREAADATTDRALAEAHTA